MADVKEHVMTKTITETYIDPDHAERSESSEFRKSKQRLKEDGHYRCYVCGTTEMLQVHHRASEWMFANIVDYDKLKAFCEEWDVYGYGKLLQHRPITSVDDIRNQLVLCRKHHIEKGTGIHEMTFPVFLMQKLAKVDPIPDGNADATLKQVEEGETS